MTPRNALQVALAQVRSYLFYLCSKIRRLGTSPLIRISPNSRRLCTSRILLSTASSRRTKKRHPRACSRERRNSRNRAGWGAHMSGGGFCGDNLGTRILGKHAASGAFQRMQTANVYSEPITHNARHHSIHHMGAGRARRREKLPRVKESVVVASVALTIPGKVGAIWAEKAADATRPWLLRTRSQPRIRERERG